MTLDNSSISSGPQFILNKQMIEPADGNWELAADKIWYLTEYATKAEDAVYFFVPPNTTQQLTDVLNMAKGMGDEESGIPLIAQGIQSPQVTDSPTGLALLQQASTTVLDYMSEAWDFNVTEKIVRWMYDWEMQYNPREEIKGVFSIKISSSTEYRNKQLYIKDLEKVSVESGQNPALGEWINQDALTRARLSMMHLPSTDIVKTQEQVDEARSQKGPDPRMMELMLKEREVAVQEQKVQLEYQKLDFENNNKQRREEMDHQERMLNAQVRDKEAEAQVMAKQYEFYTAMAQLASKENVETAKIMAQLNIKNLEDKTKKFLAGMDVSVKATDQKLTKREMDIKEKQGSGI
jgi:hypothetical protein